MSTLQTKTFELDTTIDAKASIEQVNGDVIIEGWASDVRPDRVGDVVVPGAFDESLKSFLEENPILLYNHDIDRPLGKILDLEQRPEGLWCKALVAAPTPGSWAEPVVDFIKRGITRGLSIRGKMSRPHGRDAKSGVAKVTHVDLAEISVTPLPVSPGSLFAVTQKAFGDEEDAAMAAEAEAIRDYFEAEFGKVAAAFAKIEEAKAAADLSDELADLQVELDDIYSAIAAARDLGDRA